MDVAVQDSRRFGFGAEMPLALVLVGILFVILVPLPPGLMDGLLILNLTVSLMVLMTAASVARPMDVSVFPSLLLVVTFFRLALNVATTRLILGNGGQGLEAAGGVIRAFGEFVAGKYLVVGFIVFAIIMVVQFVVITKGSTRISEVAARFTLDAMPGKQLSIDNDLASGFIDEQTARQRRAEINDQADFYGSMDGASKFVRGEAMAGIVITLVNIFGGFCVGLMYYEMNLESAARTFTRLTIGDGLVTQIPALMVSVAAALLITKNTAGKSLASDLAHQLFRNDRIFFFAACFLLVLMQSGLPKPALLFAAAVCATAGFLLRARNRVEEEGKTVVEEAPGGPPPAAPEESQEKARALLAVEPLELEIGYRLIGLVDEYRGEEDDGRSSGLMSRLGRVRESVARELGIVVPPIKVRDNVGLHPTQYSIRLRGNVMGIWRLWPGRFFVTAGEEALEGIQGVEGKDPSTGEPGLWVEQSQWSEATNSGYVVRRPEEIIPSHLEAIVRAHAWELLTREEVSRLLSNLRERAPALLEELVPRVLKVGEVQKVLQNLLREQVSIRDLETILEALADHGDESRDPGVLTEKVRQATARSICGALAGPDGTLRVALLAPALEEFLLNSLEESGAVKRLLLEPEISETFTDNAVDVLGRAATPGTRPVLVCSDSLRAQVRELLASKLPAAAVMAYGEVDGSFRLDVRGSVALENVGGSEGLEEQSAAISNQLMN